MADRTAGKDLARFVERPGSTESRLAGAILGSLTGLGLGAVATFAVALVLGIANDEHAIDLPSDWDLDAFFRPLIGLTFFAGMCGVGLLWVGARVWQTFATDRVLRRMEPGEVPIEEQRRLAASPYETLALVGFYAMMVGAVLGVCCVITTVVLVFQDDDVEIGLAITAVVIAVGLAGTALWRLAGRAAKRWQARGPVPGADRIAIARARAETERTIRHQRRLTRRRLHRDDDPDGPDSGSDEVPHLDRRAERLARRVMGLGTLAAVAAGAVLMVAVWLRKPCRTCRQRSFGEPIEALIDAQALVATILVVATVVLVTVATGTELWLSYRTRRRLVTLATRPDADEHRPAESDLQTMITSSPTRTAALLMSLWSAPLVWGGTAAALAAGDGAEPFAGRTAWWGLVVLGVLLLVGQGAVRLAGERERLATATALRRTWPVPDPPPRHPDDIGD